MRIPVINQRVARYTLAAVISLPGMLLVNSSSQNEANNQPPNKAPPVKNPLDCQIPACSDKMSMFKKAVSGVNSSSKQQTNTVDKAKTTDELVGVSLGCPLDRNELGRSSWDLLHTMAANYPNEPTEKQQKQMIGFLEALAEFYPCIHCATDFQESIKHSPPRVSSRAELSLWLCEQHNEVSEKLGKPTFPCSLAALDDRWRVSQRKECNPQAAVVSVKEKEDLQQEEAALIDAFLADLVAEDETKQGAV